jgi:predicted nucleic acid-binding protein
MEQQYLMDNNVIANYFSGALSKAAMNFVAEVIDRIPNISVITEIEALSWSNIDKNKEIIIQSFIEDSNILSLSPNVVKQCINIRRQKKIKTPDAIIAATAIVYNYILLTSDTDFKNIPHLQVLDPCTL